MIKSLTTEEKEELFNNCMVDEELKDDEFILYSSLQVRMGPCIGSDCQIWSHDTDLETLKNLYQNAILWEFVNALCYNGNIDDDRLNLVELIDAKEKDFDFYVKNQEKFESFKRLVRIEPKSFDELREYVEKTSKFLDDCGVYCEAKLYKNFDDAIDDIIEFYGGEVPGFERKVDFLNDLSTML